MALVLDTGPLLAALDAADPEHERCASLLSKAREDLVVPILVLAELDYWCHARLGAHAWIFFLEDLLAGAYRLETCTRADLERCRELQRQHDDQPLVWSMPACSRWSSGCARASSPPSTIDTSRSYAPRTSRRSTCFLRSLANLWKPADLGSIRLRLGQ
jgi:hypothetical protein